MGAGDTAKDCHSGAGRKYEEQWRQLSPGNGLLAREHVKAEDLDRALASPQLIYRLNAPGPQASREVSVGH